MDGFLSQDEIHITTIGGLQEMNPLVISMNAVAPSLFLL